MSAEPLPVPAPPLPAAAGHHVRTARRVFQASLLWTSGLTVFWVVMMVLGPDRAPFFGRYRIDKQALGAVFFGFLVFSVLWGWIWYGIRALLLRKFVGMSKEEVREIFTSRMHRPFDLAGPGPLPERRIRITDMIGRRGRFVTLGIMGFLYIYGRVAVDPKPEYLVFGAGDSLFDAMVGSWLFLAFYYSDGFLGRVVYGAQTRLMDGILGRANFLLITTLWSGFKFIFVPLSIRLAAHFPPETFAALFAFIWPSYLAADALAEIAGSLFGKQKLKVWGMGEVNRKSIEGTVAGFVASLAVCLAVVYARHLPLPWVGLAVVISLSNTLLELFSPRGTDDFTMATANALLCLGFGILVY
jgi:dolichol kinase